MSWEFKPIVIDIKNMLCVSYGFRLVDKVPDWLAKPARSDVKPPPELRNHVVKYFSADD